MSEISITKIIIRIGKKEVELTPEEAKGLRNILNDTLGEKETVCIPSLPIIIDRPYTLPYPYYPYWEVRWDNGGTFTCSTTIGRETGAGGGEVGE